MKQYVWYFGDVDRILIVDENLDWYWGHYCLKVPYIFRLGEL